MKPFKNVLMKKSVLAATLGLALMGSAQAAENKNSQNVLRGDYIEARSASVYAGPCHYSGEAMSGGRTATMAWKFKSGVWNNVDLSGLGAVAVVSAQDNLANNEAARRSVLYLDARANAQQTAALRDLFAKKFASLLGTVSATRATQIEVTNNELDYRVRAGEFASLDVNRYPCSHCTQDAQIWYQPLAPSQNIIVGKTVRHTFRDGALGQAWDEKQEANSAFAGQFEI